MKMKTSLIFAAFVAAVVFSVNAHATKLAPVSEGPTAGTTSASAELGGPAVDSGKPDISRPTVDIIKPDTNVVRPAPEFQRPLRELKPMPVSDRTLPNRPSNNTKPSNAVLVK